MVKKSIIPTLMVSLFSLALFSQTNALPATGNVGIGLLNPQEKLNVFVGSAGPSGLTGLRIGGLSNYPSLELGIENDYDGVIKTFGNDLKIYAGNWRTLGATATENHSINFYTSKGGSTNWSSPKMILNADGNLGIGTAQIDNVQNWEKVLQLHGSGHAKLLVTESSGIKVGIFSHFGYNAKIGTESNHNLTFTAGYWNDVMTLTTGGNVGIGTLSPGEKLAVNGKIRAKEIRVEATNWPDFVFNKGFNLKTLKETEMYINNHGRLPGIPGAAEVHSEGIDLGSLNTKLLQKIEELTLHLIEMNNISETRQLENIKTQDAQQLQINQLKMKLKLK